MLLFNIKKMKQIRILCMIVVLSGLYSCRKNTLSIPGTNAITTAQVFSTPATVNAYLATLYADMPVEDFAFWNGGFGNFPGNGNEYTADWTDEANWSTSSGDQSTLGDVFAQEYQALRNTNNFIAAIPSASPTAFTPAQKNYWLGEAKFIRAYEYFALVKYYGGVPLILTAQTTTVPVPRSKEVDVWN